MVEEEVWKCTGKLIELETKVIMNEVSQAQKDKYIFTYIWMEGM